MRARVLLGTLMAAAAVASFAFAAPAVAPDFSPEDFTKAILNGPMPCPEGQTAASCEANPKTRRWAINRDEDAADRPGVITAAAKPQAGKARSKVAAKPAKRMVSSKDILVTFALGSADITDKGKANLQAIANALKGSLASLDFEVAGYTDIVGTPERNQLLSEQRAEAVKTFLIAQGVSAERLKAKGYGLQHLADPVDPKGEINRRVELHRLT
jgi:outer membrane protein OmpA-like peptidoglycan-associated protein